MITTPTTLSDLDLHNVTGGLGSGGTPSGGSSWLGSAWQGVKNQWTQTKNAWSEAASLPFKELGRVISPR